MKNSDPAKGELQMKYAHVTVFPSRIEWRCREHGLVPDPEGDITGSEVWYGDITGSEVWYMAKPDACSMKCYLKEAWGRVMISLAGHNVNEMEIRYEKEG